MNQQAVAQHAEALLRTSIERAWEQQTKSWELRSSTTLAQLLANSGRPDKGGELLTPNLQLVTEGFDTKNLKEAKALLDELSLDISRLRVCFWAIWKLCLGGSSWPTGSLRQRQLKLGPYDGS